MKNAHYVHLRKRISRRLEPFPASTRWKRLLDTVVLGIGVLGPVISLPQVIEVFASKDATGLVIVTWGAWALMNIPWILYGIVHKVRPIIITYTLWFVVNGSVCLGAIKYGGSWY